MDLASQRYALLVQQLAQAYGRRYGYKSQIARRLDIHPSYVARVEAGEQKVSRHTIDRAIRAMGLDPAFFTDETPAEPRYTDYLRKEEPLRELGHSMMEGVHAQDADELRRQAVQVLELKPEEREAAARELALALLGQMHIKMALDYMAGEDKALSASDFARYVVRFADALAIGWRTRSQHAEDEEADQKGIDAELRALLAAVERAAKKRLGELKGGPEDETSHD